FDIHAVTGDVFAGAVGVQYQGETFGVPFGAGDHVLAVGFGRLFDTDGFTARLWQNVIAVNHRFVLETFSVLAGGGNVVIRFEYIGVNGGFQNQHLFDGHAGFVRIQNGLHGFL